MNFWYPTIKYRFEIITFTMMKIHIEPHTLQRAIERGSTETESLM